MKIVIITGEESGDVLGASLVDALKKTSIGEFELYGIGGSLLLKRGIQNYHHINEISVMGIVEVIPKILKIRRIINNVTQAVLELKPDIVIETGTNEGGGAHFLASIMDVIGKGKVIGVDIEELDNRADHERITYIKGSSIDNNIVKKVSEMIESNDVVLVILDSDHNMPHVLEEMKVYSEFVTKGSYMIVEDSNVNGHPIMPNWGRGPFEAIQEFLSKNDLFEVDKSCEKFYMSFNPSGYLKKNS